MQVGKGATGVGVGVGAAVAAAVATAPAVDGRATAAGAEIRTAGATTVVAARVARMRRRFMELSAGLVLSFR
ncbi:hypothetical protein ACODT5_27335 [Streptomyces sp. 5.8]|uniref:hypothetical protein n=1 Tax=Streptomyces sp. 5.8 TaxID=3406571 RepID=UPI003BB4CF4F